MFEMSPAAGAYLGLEREIQFGRRDSRRIESDRFVCTNPHPADFDSGYGKSGPVFGKKR